MARFEIEIPSDLLKSFNELCVNSEKMLMEMTEAGAKVVLRNVKTNMKKSFNHTERLEKHLHLSKNYRTPSDDGINTNVYFSGYLDDEKKHPAPLAAIAREYGTKTEPRKPFFRKSFKQSDITKKMEVIQKKYLPKE